MPGHLKGRRIDCLLGGDPDPGSGQRLRVAVGNAPLGAHGDPQVPAVLLQRERGPGRGRHRRLRFQMAELAEREGRFARLLGSGDLKRIAVGELSLRGAERQPRVEQQRHGQGERSVEVAFVPEGVGLPFDRKPLPERRRPVLHVGVFDECFALHRALDVLRRREREAHLLEGGLRGAVGVQPLVPAAGFRPRRRQLQDVIQVEFRLPGLGLGQTQP